MRTKTSDRPRVLPRPVTTGVPAPSFPDTVAYWLEDDLGNRVSKLFAASEKPLRLAGRVLENPGALDGWTVRRYGYTPRQMNEIERLMALHRERLLRGWHEHFGE